MVTYNIRKIFLDTEFTELTQKAKLLSLAMVAETGEKFYAELTDYDPGSVDNWVRENVLKNFYLDNSYYTSLSSLEVLGSEGEVASAIKDWLGQFKPEEENLKFQFWGDCPAWDWILFCELFGGSFGRPSGIHYMCLDVATVFQIKGYDPDYDRNSFLQEHGIIVQGHQHNALYDAMVTKHCFEILTQK